MLSPETQELARRLLEYEAVVDKAPESSGSALIRLSEKLRLPLCTIVGLENYRVLLSRALVLAKADTTSLNLAQITPEGSLAGISDPQTDDRAGIDFIAQLLDMFLALLGTPLILRLLQDISPHLDVTSPPGALPPFEYIRQEVAELTNVSDRLASLADQYPSVGDALLSISGNVRDTATLLEVVALIKNPANNPTKAPRKTKNKPYLM